MPEICTNDRRQSCSYTISPSLLKRRELPQKVTRALITARVIIQVQLMVLLRVPPLARLQDLGADAALPPLLARLLRDLFRYCLLLIIMVEDPASVLRANVWALPVGGRGIVHAVEVLDEFAVGELGGVED